MQLIHGLDQLEAQGRMTWIEARHGWATVPDDVVEALSRDGLVFIAIDGEARRDHAFSSLERDPYADDGGES
jgi:hypothetical protein